jgi:hypothetical protein
MDVPTVERETMDLQDPTLRMFNFELLAFSGIFMRLTLEHGMTTLGVEYDKGAVERAKLEQKLLTEDEEKKKKKSPTPIEEVEEEENNNSNNNSKTKERADSTDDGGGDPKSTSTSSASAVWGFAKFMVKGVKQTIVQVVNKMEEMVDDGGELMHPRRIS